MKTTRLLLTALSLGSSLLSFLSYTLLLQQLGTSAQVDALFVAASVPVGMAGLLTAVLVYLLPTRLTELPPPPQEAALRQLARWIWCATAVALTIVPAASLHDGSGLAATMLFGFVLYAGVSVAGTLLVCRAQAAGRYLLAGLNQFLLVLGLVAGVLMAINSQQVGWVVLGQLAGAIAALVALARSLRLQGLLRVRPGADAAALRELMAPLRRHLPHILVASTAFTLFQPIDAY
ncbi:MAG: hypothetical protein WAQ05_17290, partial [Rubrivivax sp.]